MRISKWRWLTYYAARERWPEAAITLRQGARVIEDSRRLAWSDKGRQGGLALNHLEPLQHHLAMALEGREAFLHGVEQRHGEISLMSALA